VHRPAFSATFVAEPGVDAVRALRGFLKLALRRFGLRAIEAREETNMSAYRDKIKKAPVPKPPFDDEIPPFE
jgi:hypothetical protein